MEVLFRNKYRVPFSTITVSYARSTIFKTDSTQKSSQGDILLHLPLYSKLGTKIGQSIIANYFFNKAKVDGTEEYQKM